MRLITWNCKGAFHRKFVLMEAMAPDVLVVPECEKIQAITQSFGAKPMRSVHWIGNSPRKGLGVFAFGEYSLEVHSAYDPRHQWILPLRVSGPVSFTLLAVWTVPHAETKSYVQPLLAALATYDEFHATGDIVWAGDFNAGVRFDTPTRHFKFSDFVAALSPRDVHSLYHRANNSVHGAESDSTFYQHHNPEKGHHIDYIFAGRQVHAYPHQITVGDCETWKKHSDHVPLILDLQNPEKA